MSQTSDNSRTFRVLNLTDEVKSALQNMNVVVTQHENVNYLEVLSKDLIESVRKMLDEGEIKYKQCSYSTFVRFKEDVSLEKLNQTANELANGVNILYSRVDENNHTGKLVVDRLEDYNKLKNSTGDINFYRFSPLNVPRVQNRNYQGNDNNQPRQGNGEWTTVQPNPRGPNGYRGQRNTVSGQYTQSPVMRGESTPRGRGRGRPRAAPSA
jgi:hypothetical protein